MVDSYGIRNKVKGKKFVVICSACKKEVPSVVEGICEDCFDKRTLEEKFPKL